MNVDNPSRRARKTESSVEWYTPAPLLMDMIDILGGQWADPCTSAAARAYQDSQGVPPPCAFATLAAPCEMPRRVPLFINPPYGTGIEKWVEMANWHPAGALLLVPGRTDTKWWQTAARDAAGIAFLKGRLAFIEGYTGQPVKGNTVGSTIVAFKSYGAFDDPDDRPRDISYRLARWVYGHDHTFADLP